MNEFENPNGMVLDVDQNPKKIGQWLIFAVQHILAMLVACITVPLLTGLAIAPTLIAAGVGTIAYILITKMKSPVFLSSSFAYISPMISAMGVGLMNQATGNNYLALILGMLMVGAVYGIVALVVKFAGTGWLNKLLPSIVVGPVIMVIGLGLAGSAISNLTSASGITTAGADKSYNLIAILCGLIALFVTAFCSHYGKGKMISLIPFVVGMGSGYIAAVLFTVFGYYLGNVEYFHIFDFTPFVKIFGEGNFSFASFFNYKLFVPNDENAFLFLHIDEISKFDWASIGEVALLFVPVAFVTICEHIGDHENLGNILQKDLLNGEPGMTRTLAGDGLATALSGALCGAANTTYGENVAVIGTTKIASVKVVLLAAILSVAIGFFTPFTALLSTIPSCVTGGVSLILYGFIASSGVKMLIQQHIDLTNTKNIFIASVILVAGIGGLSLQFGPSGSPFITISATAVSMILGIIMNYALKDKGEKSGAIGMTDAASEDKTEEIPSGK
ncbi:MAG: solute carrier family 23 protein [Bacilli bacterium]